MYKYAEACTRLANHANLADEHAPESESLLWALWNAERTNNFPELDFFVDDILSCLESVNCELNGPTPSESIGYQNSNVVADLSYVMASLQSSLARHLVVWKQKDTFTSDEYDMIEQGNFVISHCWAQVLAGDIDNLREDIKMVYLTM